MSRLEEQDFDEKRLARRQKRKRSQLIAYILLISFIVVVIGAAVFAGISIKRALGSKSQSGQEAEAEDSSSAVSGDVVIASPEADSEPQEMTEDDIMSEVTSDIISTMPLEDKIASLFIITPEQLTGVETAVKAGSGTQDALQTYAVGGLVYSAKNIKSEDQIKEMLQTTSSMSKYPVFTVVSEEGDGAIASSIGVDNLVDVVDSDSAYNQAAAIATAMFQYGFDFDIAPTVDLSEGGRYGIEVDSVKDQTSNFTAGLQESGVSSCMASFPTTEYATDEMYVNDRSKEDLVTSEYSVFKNAIDNAALNAVMLSNASYPGIVGDNTPASLSSVMIEEELRGALGFEGIVVTGPLDEGAITAYYTPDQAAVSAIKAGADLIYRPEDFETAYNGLLTAVQNGDITEDRINESLARIFRIKYSDRIDQITGDN